ncbi:MAG: SHOCT domain-containing protein [bacterium]
MMRGWGYGYYGGWFGWLGPIFTIVFWTLAIAGLVFLIRWLVIHSKPSNREDSALEILRRRYAKGEISKEEFEEKRRDLL